jgi:hypothetical protein
MCLACEDQFERYLEPTMQCLLEASAVCSDPSLSTTIGEEFMTIIAELRIAIVDAYSSVTHGILLQRNTPEHIAKMRNFAVTIYQYLSSLLIGGLVSDVNSVKNIIELIIDLAFFYGNDLQPLIRQQGIAQGI